MASHGITVANDFAADHIDFSDVRKNKMGGKAVYLSHNSNKKIYIQLPYLRAPYGLSSYTDQTSGRVSYSLDLSLDQTDEKGAAALKLFDAIDEKVLNHVASNSSELLGKKYNKAVLQEALFKPLVRRNKEGKYPPTMKLKVLQNRDGGFVPEAYNSKRDKVDLGEIEKGQNVTTIIDISQIWFIDNKFGVTVRLMQAKLAPTAKLPACAFTEDEYDAPVDESDAEEELVDY